MSSNVSPMPERQLRLPAFEGYKVHHARIAFGGALVLALDNEDDIAFVQALKLGQELKVTLAVEGYGRPVDLGAKVVLRAHGFKKEDESELVQSRYRIAINHRGYEAEDDGAE